MKKFFKFLLTALFPWLHFLFKDKNKEALICFVLQLTIVGWLPCAIWACRDLKSPKVDVKKNASQNEK